MPAPTPQTDLIGQVVDGRYRIRGILGRGGMGVVYEAEAIRLGKRPCAIKVLLPEFTRNETVVARFEREAEVAARVKHPNVVEIFDTGQTSGGLGYIAMELLIGETLDRTLREAGTLPWPRVQKLLLQVCRALAVAHAHGVTHRDIKPENIFRSTVDGDPDFVKVLDFGVAKLTEVDGDVESARLTATNSVIGTYAYMAYEQICGEPVDHRVDVWAVGVLLYEMLTGRLPFRGANQGQIWKAISSYDPEPMADIVAGVPDGADAVVQMALAKDRDRRYPTIEALARALARVTVDGSPAPPSAARAAATPGRSTVDARAETAIRDGVPDTLGARTISPHGLTELVSDGLRPITDATAHAHVAASTHPGRFDPPPVREAMQTDVPAPILHPPPPEPRPAAPRKRAIVLIALTAIAAASLLHFTRTPEPTSFPAEPTPPIAAPAPPDPLPVIREPDPPVLLPDEPPPEPTPVDPPPIKLATEETHAARVTRELRRVRDHADTKRCFAKFQPNESLAVSITVHAATGVARITYPPLKGSSPLATCLGEVFAARTFPKGKPGEPNFKTKQPFVFNKQ